MRPHRACAVASRNCKRIRVLSLASSLFSSSNMVLFLLKRNHRNHRYLRQQGTRRGTLLGHGGTGGTCSWSRPDRSIMFRAMLLCVATESARNRAFWDNPWGAPVRSSWQSAMREIWWDAIPDDPPNVSSEQAEQSACPPQRKRWCRGKLSAARRLCEVVTRGMCDGGQDTPQ
jgi:hypothetical protein